jgi:hypothetical protein
MDTFWKVEREKHLTFSKFPYFCRPRCLRNMCATWVKYLAISKHIPSLFTFISYYCFHKDTFKVCPLWLAGWMAGLRWCPSCLAGYAGYNGWITWLAVLAMLSVFAVYAGRLWILCLLVVLDMWLDFFAGWLAGWLAELAMLFGSVCCICWLCCAWLVCWLCSLCF